MDQCAYLPTPEEIEEHLMRLRQEKVKQLVEGPGQSCHLKSHGRVLRAHHSHNGEVVWEEDE